MRKKRLPLSSIVTLLLFFATGIQYAHAQYFFSESFSQPGVLASSGWHVNTSHSTTFRDTVNGWMQPGTGSLHVSFTDMSSGTMDTLILPAFTATAANDSLVFDHAHRGDLSQVDSMAIWYSTDGGTTYAYLISYAANAVPSSTTLSTVVPTTTWGKFYPAGPSDWAHKAAALPTGTNKLQFIFYSDAGDELYLDNILAGKDPVSCSGTPATVNLPVSATVCSGTSYTISPNALPYDPYITYQWQQSLDNGATDPWVYVSNIGGINSSELFLTNITQDMWYRVESTCPNGGLSSTSSATHIVLDSTFNCYCRTNLGGNCTGWITNVSISGTDLNNSSGCDAATPGQKFTYYPPSLTTCDSITAGQPIVTINVSTTRSLPFYGGKVGFWIDYNKNGIYEPSEFGMINTTLPTGTSSYTFSVPATAASGYTGMRVRVIETFYVGFNGSSACDALPGGETEDYLIYINPLPTCSGTPNAAIPVTQTPDICSGSNAIISAQGVSFGAGITYEWEESDDNGITDPWTTTSSTVGVYTPTLTTSTLTDTMYYRLKTVCTNTTSSAYSPSIAINVKPLFMCYCSTNLGGSLCSSSGTYISNVTVSGSALNNSSGCSSTPGSYSSFGITPTTTDTFDQDEMITLGVTNALTANQIGVWIDYDGNGIYDAAEYTEIASSSTPGVATFKDIIIPATANTGYTGMRIRNSNTGGTLNPYGACNYMSSGETEDYIIYIQPAQTCSGTPGTGVVNTNQSICSGKSATIKTTGASYGPGISYQWEQSTDAGITDPWVSVTTGTGSNSRIFTTAPLPDSMYYRLQVTCAYSSVAYSDTIKIAMNPHYECYCKNDLSSGNSCTWGEYISSVNILGGYLNNSSTCTSTGLNNYTFNPPGLTTTDTLTVGQVFNMGVSISGGPSRIAAWIDYDHSGSYDANEFIHISTSAPAGSTKVVQIEIPATALAGQTGLRIRTTQAAATLDASDACTQLSTGETEDYIIMINAAPVCSGKPTSGIIPSSYLICANKPFDIRAGGAIYNTGITYQWEESDDNGVLDPWADVAGENTRVLGLPGITSDKYFRLKSVCTLTPDSVYTGVMHMIVDSFFNCYDAAVNIGGGNCSSFDMIDEVSITGTSLFNNSSSSCSVTALGTRSSFYAGGSTTTTLLAQKDYRLNVSSLAYASIGVWIDFDRNGIFDAAEFTLVTPNSGAAPVSANISIPASALPGLTGMRIRTNQPTTSAGVMDPTSAATYFYAGETEDYIITIDTLKPVINLILNNISSNDVTVSWNNGNGNARLVLAKEVTTPLTDPVNGTDYPLPGSIYASGDSTANGNYIVYNNETDTFVTVTGLNPLTQYEFYVYEYLYTSFGPVYSLPGQLASGTTLPVSMLSLNAAKKQQDVLLNWSTASESNNKGFTVERSMKGNEWEYVTFIDGKGNSHTVSRYEFTDLAPFASQISTLYYRLRQEDFDGKVAYSPVVSVSTENVKTSVALHPNPFRESITLSIQSEKQAELHVTVRDIFGKTITETTMATDKGNTTFTLDQLSHLAEGIYFLQVEQQGEVQNFKVTKTR